MAVLRNRIERASEGTGRIGGELHAARQQRERRIEFLTDHRPDTDRLSHVEHAYERRLAECVDRLVKRTPAYLVATLGPVPAEPDRLATWKRGALVIERHRAEAGITDPTHPFGTRADGRAALLPIEVRQELRPVQRALNAEPPSLGPSLAIGF